MLHFGLYMLFILVWLGRLLQLCCELCSIQYCELLFIDYCGHSATFRDHRVVMLAMIIIVVMEAIVVIDKDITEVHT